MNGHLDACFPRHPSDQRSACPSCMSPSAVLASQLHEAGTSADARTCGPSCLSERGRSDIELQLQGRPGAAASGPGCRAVTCHPPHTPPAGLSHGLRAHGATHQASQEEAHARQGAGAHDGQAQLQALDLHIPLRARGSFCQVLLCGLRSQSSLAAAGSAHPDAAAWRSCRQQLAALEERERLWMHRASEVRAWGPACRWLRSSCGRPAHAAERCRKLPTSSCSLSAAMVASALVSCALPALTLRLAASSCQPSCCTSADLLCSRICSASPVSCAAHEVSWACQQQLRRALG